MPIVNRRTFIAKRGHFDEVVSMLKQGSENNEYPHRIYRSHYGRFDQVAFEIEFESMAQMEEIWNEWFASPEGEQFGKRWVEITESGGTNEIWIRE